MQDVLNKCSIRMRSANPESLRKPHILFVLDKIPAHSGGIYAIVKWIIDKVQTFEHGGRRLAVQISCTTYYPKDHPSHENNAGCQDLQLRDVNIVYPTTRRGQRDIRHDIDSGLLNKHPKTYFTRLDQFKGITHVVLLAPITDTSALPDIIKKREGKLKVIVLSHISTLGTREIKILRQNVETDFLCVGTRVHYDYVMKTKQIRYGNPVCVFPTSLNIRERTKPSTGFSILTLYNEYNRSPLAKYTDCFFLDTVAKSLGKLLRDIRMLEQSAEIKWYIHWPTFTDDINKWERKLYELADTPALELDFKQDPDITTLVGMNTLCIQPGYFDMEGYSGLETLLCGIPTLVIAGSDVAEMLFTTLAEKNMADYFLTLQDFKDTCDPSEQWSQTLLEFFLDSKTKHNFDVMFGLLKAYLISQPVQQGITDMISILTGATLPQASATVQQPTHRRRGHHRSSRDRTNQSATGVAALSRKEQRHLAILQADSSPNTSSPGTSSPNSSPPDDDDETDVKRLYGVPNVDTQVYMASVDPGIQPDCAGVLARGSRVQFLPGNDDLNKRDMTSKFGDISLNYGKDQAELKAHDIHETLKSGGSKKRPSKKKPKDVMAKYEKELAEKAASKQQRRDNEGNIIAPASSSSSAASARARGVSDDESSDESSGESGWMMSVPVSAEGSGVKQKTANRDVMASGVLRGDSSDEDAEGRPGVFKGVDNLPKYHKQRKYPKQKGSYKDVKFIYK